MSKLLTWILLLLKDNRKPRNNAESIIEPLNHKLYFSTVVYIPNNVASSLMVLVSKSIELKFNQSNLIKNKFDEFL